VNEKKKEEGREKKKKTMVLSFWFNTDANIS
jgi:hypothetical protein